MIGGAPTVMGGDLSAVETFWRCRQGVLPVPRSSPLWRIGKLKAVSRVKYRRTRILRLMSVFGLNLSPTFSMHNPTSEQSSRTSSPD